MRSTGRVTWSVSRASRSELGRPRRATTRAIDWLWGCVEDEALLLEDDCVPEPWLFPGSCDQLLSRVPTSRARLDRVWFSTPWAPGVHLYQWSYFFGHTECWGMGDVASARGTRLTSTWLVFGRPDSSRKLVEHLVDGDGPTSLSCNSRQLLRDKLDLAGLMDGLSPARRHGGLMVLPCENLVKNIGFGPDAAQSTGSCVRVGTYQARPGGAPNRCDTLTAIEIDRVYENALRLARSIAPLSN